MSSGDVQQIPRQRKRLQSRELRMHLITELMLKGPYAKSNCFAIWIMRMLLKLRISYGHQRKMSSVMCILHMNLWISIYIK